MLRTKDVLPEGRWSLGRLKCRNSNISWINCAVRWRIGATRVKVLGTSIL